MIYFEKWYEEFAKWDISNKDELSKVLHTFCSEGLIREKDLKIFLFYLNGKKQRELSIIFNMHQPYISRSVNLSRKIIKNVHSFIHNEEIGKSLEVAKNVLTENEYKILNYRLVGYTFQTIAEPMQTSYQYVGAANNSIMKKFKKHIKNNRIHLLYTHLQKINRYWRNKKNK